MNGLRRLIHDQRGTTVTEFVLIAPLLFALVFLLLELPLAFYYWQSVEKAAQAGAYMAVIRDPAVTGLPATNARTANGIFGQRCSIEPSPCQGFATLECSGTGCTGPGYAVIRDRMQQIFPLIDDDNIRIRYEYVRLGFAGGDPVPAVTVTLTGVGFPLAPLNLILDLFGDDNAFPDIIPDIRATYTREDMSTAGAG